MPSLDHVVHTTGATYRQLDHWCRMGYLHPGSPGTGHSRVWPSTEIVVAAKMVRLVKAGISPRVAEQVARGQSNIGHGVTVTIT